MEGPAGQEAVGAAFTAQLLALRSREIGARVTLVGPHRDDVRFLIDDVDAGIYGSRGQQRTVALALKLAEVDLMKRETGEYPVLLLDDVLSELDEQRRHFLVHTLEDGVEQVIITTTDLHTLPEAFLQRCHLWLLQMGSLSKIETQPADT
jgi:DNA replication and repair protein RecF